MLWLDTDNILCDLSEPSHHAMETETDSFCVAHVVPAWCHELVPLADQLATSNWTLQAQFDPMSSTGIQTGVPSVSAPGTIAYTGDEA